jgi:hypothetical protein
MRLGLAVARLLAMPPKGRRWVWAVFGLALPALLSFPLLYLPFPYRVSPRVLFAVVTVLTSPRYWAAAATCLAVCGAKRWAESPLQLLCATCIVILAWLSAGQTAWRLFHTF